MSCETCSFFASFVFLSFFFACKFAQCVLQFFLVFSIFILVMFFSFSTLFLCLLKLHYLNHFYVCSNFTLVLLLHLHQHCFHVYALVLFPCGFLCFSLLHLCSGFTHAFVPTSFVRLLLRHYHAQVPCRPNLISIILRLVLSLSFILCKSRSPLKFQVHV